MTHLNSTTEPTGTYASHIVSPEEFSSLWDAIVVDQQIKDSLLSQAILNFTLRPKVDRAVVPLHGIILLTGKPGTGKTSLARGLASRTAESLNGKGLRYTEVEPHSLASAAHGKTQKAVTELFSVTIAELAMQGPTFVLLDEVETILADRAKLSLQANPIDVHRATDAALVQLDRLAAEYNNLLLVATSNFPAAIDSAFLSRTDLILEMPLPNAQACRQILTDTVRGMAAAFPPLKKLLNDPELDAAARACAGLDGRQIRKLVAAACTFDKRVAADPSKLTGKDIRMAAERAQKGMKL
jgi:SpoVK/Ycf46/Vps4 family AAA+-type ATPase